MKFPLIRLEEHLDAALVDAASDLLQEGALLWIKELERHLWQAKLEAEGEFYPEVQISPSKVLAHSCDCATGRAGKPCVHIAALLLRLREQRNARLALPPAEKKAASLTSARLLDAISHEELKAFVRHYARSHRQFDLAFKAHFASQVGLKDDLQKYEQVIKNVLSFASKRNGQVTRKGLKRLEGPLRDLLQQAAQLMADSAYQEAFFLLLALVRQLSPFMLKEGSAYEDLHDYNREAFALLAKLCQQPLPPDLAETLHDLLKTELGQAKNHYAGTLAYWAEALQYILRQMDREAELLEYFYELLPQGVNAKHRQELEALQMHALSKMGDKRALEDFLYRHLDNLEVWNMAARRAEDLGEIHKIKHLLKAADLEQLALPAERRLALELKVARHDGDGPAILRLAKAMYLETLDPFYLDLIEAQDGSAAHLAELAEQLQQHKYQTAVRDGVALLYVRLADWDGLLAYIGKIRSIDLLQKYLSPLLAERPDVPLELAKGLLNSYLQHYVGQNNMERVVALVEAFKQHGPAGQAEALREYISQEYRGRFALVQRLKGLF